MKLRWLVVLPTFLLSACAGVDPGPGPAVTTAPSGTEGPVFVDTTDILQLESFPVQVRMVVKGSLPTPCHEARWEVDDGGAALRVRLWSSAPLGQDCAQVLEPFEASIPLGSFASGTRIVLLNGEEVGRFTIGAEPEAARVSVVGGGWSFGMCGGYCTADLVIEGDELVLTGSGRIGEEPLFVHVGRLTAMGRERLATAAGRLHGVPLEPIYGCPDCADGGAANLVLDRAGDVSRHDMDFGRPPEVFDELHGMAMALIDALEICVSDELVTVADDCEPWQGS